MAMGQKIIETQNLFIKSLQQQNAEQLSSLFHHIGLHSGLVEKRISKIISLLKVSGEIDKDILDHLNKISFSNKQISVISSLGSTGGITDQMDKEDQDLVMFILEYLENICKKYYDEPEIEYENNFNKKLIKNFIPFEMIYFINNFISNSKKAHAKKIKFIFSGVGEGLLLEIIDNGDGLNSKIVDEKNIFEKNFSLTNGSGLGLYDAKKIIKKINGSISVERQNNGTKFSIKIKK